MSGGCDTTSLFGSDMRVVGYSEFLCLVFHLTSAVSPTSRAFPDDVRYETN